MVDTGNPHWKAMIGSRLNDVKTVGGILWAKYTGASTCNAIGINQWVGNQQCELLPAGHTELPEQACIDGIKMRCDFL